MKTNMRTCHRYSWLLCLALLLPGGLQAEETADTAALGEVTVTGTREAELKAETPATVDSIDKQEVQAVKPGHPSEIVERIPGVHLPVTGGEGHQTAIRQPITTSPVYLYLEDGIPTRSTGFLIIMPCMRSMYRNLAVSKSSKVLVLRCMVPMPSVA